MKLKTVLIWLSGALFTGGAWQHEVVKLRAIHGESYSLPFFLTTDFNYVLWSRFWYCVMLSSYILLFACTQISWKKKRIMHGKKYLLFLSVVLFSIAMWQLEVYVINEMNSEPYSIPFTALETKPPMELTGGEETFSPVFESSFWGDVWMGIIILSYALLFIRIL